MALLMSKVLALTSIHGFNNEYSKVLNLMFNVQMVWTKIKKNHEN